jgi:hypothetical protein
LGASGTLGRATRPLRARTAVDVPPAVLFGADRVTADVVLERLLFVVEHQAPEIVVRRIDAAEVAGRMAASLAHHRAGFMDLYWRFAYAFPGRRSPLIEGANELEARLLHARLDGVPAFEVAHPARPSLRGLADAIADGLASVTDDTVRGDLRRADGEG